MAQGEDDSAANRRMSIAGQAMVIIGAASGIGKATAELIASRDAHVLCVDRDAQGNQESCRGMKEWDVHPVTADVTDFGSLQKAVEVALGKWGAVHGLVNCAGITGVTGSVTHLVELSDFEHVVRTNLLGTFLASKAVLPQMVQQGYGRIVHVASISGKEGNAGMAAYSASKAGVIGLVKVLGKEYATNGVTINALAPAVIMTPLIEKLAPAQVDYMTSRIPMHRCGTLTEVADMIGWIVSPAASFTTGFTFDLSGGRAVY
jgi:3-oxoacyl-[acyl-carrier protein] reductase